ncbi:MAG TPA: 2Fe-2S iron-sulfur cluster-binding protein, partial [Tepidisphaeraceae bacterium]
MRRHLVFYINGQRQTVEGSLVFASLTDYLRQTLQLTGTKVVCAEGDCGSCSVLLGKPADGKMVYEPVCGCIKRLFQLDGTHIVTVEGLSYNRQLNPVQESMARCHGAQCGYCTPGFVVTMHQLLDDGRPKEEALIRRKLTGNLCRCTGYEPILRAAAETDLAAMKSIKTLYPPGQWSQDLAAAANEPVLIETAEKIFFKPTSLEAAAEFRGRHAECLVVAGGTDVGVVMNKRGLSAAVTMSTHAIAGFDAVECNDNVIRIG